MRRTELLGYLLVGIVAASFVGCGNGLEELRRDAANGDPVAQYNLGERYAEGKGVDQDAVEAVKWYRKASDQGAALGDYGLGNAYEHGAGVPQDQMRAAEWYRKAADKGLAKAQFSLGLAYEDGRGVPRDYLQAHKWANLAASRAQGELREMAAKLRETLSWVMTPAQVAEAQQLASDWRPQE